MYDVSSDVSSVGKESILGKGRVQILRRRRNQILRKERNQIRKKGRGKKKAKKSPDRLDRAILWLLNGLTLVHWFVRYS
jgi:uncharacterized membrane protein YgaE (UPF0421/DUF939 family)